MILLNRYHDNYYNLLNYFSNNNFINHTLGVLLLFQVAEKSCKAKTLQEFKTTELEYKIRTRAVENVLRSRAKHDVHREKRIF